MEAPLAARTQAGTHALHSTLHSRAHTKPPEWPNDLICTSIHMGNKGKRSPGGTIFDRLLVPRIENYGSNNDITETDEVCEYLRRNYKEYTRQKLPAFRQQVERAVAVIARRGGVTKAELRLQVGSLMHVCSSRRRLLPPAAAAAATGFHRTLRFHRTPPPPIAALLPACCIAGGRAATHRWQQRRRRQRLGRQR